MASCPASFQYSSKEADPRIKTLPLNIGVANVLPKNVKTITMSRAKPSYSGCSCNPRKNKFKLLPPYSLHPKMLDVVGFKMYLKIDDVIAKHLCLILTQPTINCHFVVH